MFVVDAAVLLPYPPDVVLRVVERLPALPRWCAGLRRVRHPAPEHAVGTGCVFTYATPDARLTLRARTLDLATGAAAMTVEHSATGDGLSLTWTLVAEPDPAGHAPIDARGAAHGGRPHTRLRVRTAVEVDPAHPTAAIRSALCRVIARRAPADLERLRALLDRYEAGRQAVLAPAAGPIDHLAPRRAVW